MDDALAVRLTLAARRLSHRYRQLTERHLSELGLRAGQEVLVQVIDERGSLNQAELAAALDVEPPTVATMLRRIEPLGLIERITDPSDRRALQLCLTPAGRATAAQLRELTTSLAREATSGIPDAELDGLVEGLERLADAVPAASHARRRTTSEEQAAQPGLERG